MALAFSGVCGAYIIALDTAYKSSCVRSFIALQNVACSGVQSYWQCAGGVFFASEKIAEPVGESKEQSPKFAKILNFSKITIDIVENHDKIALNNS